MNEQEARDHLEAFREDLEDGLAAAATDHNRTGIQTAQNGLTAIEVLASVYGIILGE